NADGVAVDGAPNLLLGSTADLLLNVIGGNGGYGVSLANVIGGWLEGNFIGVDGLGTMALPNGLDGVALAGSSGVTLNRNLISGNIGRGVSIDAASSQNSLTGNVIGSDVWGLSLLGNGSDGVAIFGSENEIAGGQILYNGAAGLLIEGNNAISNSVSSTAFFGNLALGIDLGGDGVTPNDPLDIDAGPNQLQNSPVISDVVITLVDTTISGYLESAVEATYTVELYGNPFCDGSGYGEGYWPLGTVMVTTDGSGYGAFELVLAEPLAAGTFVSGLATDAAGNSSEFGACLPEPGDFAAVLVSPANPAQTVGSGLTAVYEMQLINLGNVADSYTLTVSGDWAATLSVMVTPMLQPGETFTFTVSVMVPAGTPINTSDETLISAISAYNNDVVGFSTATTTVGWLRLLLPIIIH
ncbi:MAG: right-handed parallel beta-helix repeat-containing protein, partial [Anaerolineales bacterium]|nr:right-handed parallel beta-helix repeat-containing protein [Anaerolineales bacterium]